MHLTVYFHSTSYEFCSYLIYNLALSEILSFLCGDCCSNKIWNIRQIALGMENEPGTVLNTQAVCPYFSAHQLYQTISSSSSHQAKSSHVLQEFRKKYGNLHPYAGMSNNFTLGKKQPCKSPESICIWALYESERKEVGVSMMLMLMCILPCFLPLLLDP